MSISSGSLLPTVSVCLPTCHRPELVVQCIDSCLAQSYDNLEIVIGDDSNDARTQQLIEARYRDEPRVRYTLNRPPLGQARNVASLFERATGDKILLIHDDDLLTTDGVEKLVSIWKRHPQLDAAFGDQYEADHAGTIDFDGSRQLNVDFRRTRDAEGLQPLPGRTGLIQMFPNNGWMADAQLVKRIGYSDQYGMCCDFVFGAQLCLAAREVFYLHDYVSVYRKTATSISHSTRGTAIAATVSAYAFVKALSLPASLEPSRRLALRRLAPIVVSVHARNRQVRAGLKILFGHLFAYRYGLTKRFYYHLAMLARAGFSVRPQAVAAAVAAVAAAPAVAAEPVAAVKELVSELVADRSEPV
ncbi:glycosyltransferase family 2 protein [Paraburkholderia bryophila]|uniref:Glycosyltransferase involved in cell wall biosynthesis n=1 Tax=Paraburkholderia bryophila TaxID=420952 RepID=A0A7Z0B539_9BURK|nr:glycosyltransferase family 2 protein [Paraburkholderia bryophila]NYH20673.1 glycosyltransferase involved in cell wall biosynthesis [Paraburkholderia bryophila]